ncbi:MAG: pyridoxamine 5'-phosphate oxidase family protein [Pseudomonadota bacterium]
MEEKIAEFLKARTRGVLATCYNGRPHASFMTYIADEQGVNLFMASLKGTTKYRTLTVNPKVSFLVDNRDDCLRGAAPRIQALTAAGICEDRTSDPDKDSLFQRLAEIDPGLANLVRSPEAALLRLRVESFLFLDGPMESRFVEV